MTTFEELEPGAVFVMLTGQGKVFSPAEFVKLDWVSCSYFGMGCDCGMPKEKTWNAIGLGSGHHVHFCNDSYVREV